MLYGCTSWASNGTGSATTTAVCPYCGCNCGGSWGNPWGWITVVNAPYVSIDLPPTPVKRQPEWAAFKTWDMPANDIEPDQGHRRGVVVRPWRRGRELRHRGAFRNFHKRAA